MNKFLENAEKITDGRYRFKESYAISFKDKINLSEDELNSLKESTGKDITAGFRVKVWERSNLNKNGRKYDRVFETILREKYVTMGLVDHPEGNKDGNPKDIYAIQKNPAMDENWLAVDCYFVGDNGRLAEEILEKGGYICISSSCLGQVDYDGYVMEEGFELERYGDWVMAPSNGVKHFSNESFQETKEKTTISNDTTIYNIEEKNKNESLDNKENKMSVKLLEQNVKAIIQTSKTIENSYDRMKHLQESYSDLNSLSEDELSDKLIEYKKEISNYISELETSIVEQAKSVGPKDVEIATLKESENKLTLIVEDLQKTLQLKTVILEDMEKSITDLEAKIVILERDNSQLIKEADEKKDDDKKDADKKKADEKDDATKYADKNDKAADVKDDEKDKKDKDSNEDKVKTQANKDKKEKDEDEKTNADKVKTKESAKVSIFKYYRNTFRENPSISEIESSILESKDVAQATVKVMDFLGKSKETSGPSIKDLLEGRGTQASDGPSLRELIQERNQING